MSSMYVNKGLKKGNKTGKRLRERSFIYKEIVRKEKYKTAKS